MQVNWTESALDDLAAIQSYIARDSAYYAKQFIERIFDAVEKLAIFPELGRQVPEAEERNEVRELIFQGYRIIYAFQAHAIFVVAVVHGARDLSAMTKSWNANQTFPKSS